MSGSEIDLNTTDATAGSTADADVTVTEDLEDDLGRTSVPLSDSQPLQKQTTTNDNTNTNKLSGNKTHTAECVKGNNIEKPILKRLSSLNLNETNITLSDNETKGLHVCTNNIFKNDKYKPSTSSDYCFNKIKTNENNKENKDSTKNISVLGSDKWCTSKEKFLENELATEKNNKQQDDKKYEKKELQVPKVNLGTVLVKESFIEPPRMTRISNSFHGKTSNTTVDITPRRASDSVPSLCKPPDTLKNIFPTSKAPKSPRRCSEIPKSNIEKQLVTQLSQPSSSNVTHNNTRKASLNTDSVPTKTRFTTTLVDEAEHAASVLEKEKAKNDPSLTLAGSCSITHGFQVDKS